MSSEKKSIFVFETPVWDDIMVYLAQIYADEEDFIAWIKKDTTYPFTYINIDSVQDLADISHVSGDDLFSDTDHTDKEEHYLINVSALSFSHMHTEQQFLQFCQAMEGKTVYMYSHSLAVTAALKKKWGAYVTFIPPQKYSTELAKDIGIQYRNQLQIMITEKQIDMLIKHCISYSEILDALDCISLSSKPQNMLELLLPATKPALFILPFNPHKQNADAWRASVSNDEYQLALSLMMTKLGKLPHDALIQSWKEYIIKTDEMMKSSTRISLESIWNLLLWQYERGLCQVSW